MKVSGSKKLHEAAEDLVHRWRQAGKIGAEGQKQKTVSEPVPKFLAESGFLPACRSYNCEALEPKSLS